MAYKHQSNSEYMRKWRQRRKDHIRAYKLQYKKDLELKFHGICQCGCGFKVKGVNSKGAPIIYKRGHNPTRGQTRPRGLDNKNYKGGWILLTGYRAQSLVIDGERKTVLEHRFIVEKILKRKLNRNEHVHHIDGNKLNNNPNNLAVLSAHAHQKYHKAGVNYGIQAIS